MKFARSHGWLRMLQQDQIYQTKMNLTRVLA